MSGLFGTLNISKKGLNTAQTTIDVTSHNISNANTDGYSRQRAKVEASTPITIDSSVGQLGTGAQVSAIERVRDSFLDFQVRDETSTLGTNNVRSSFLSEVETIFNEPSEAGISTLMGKFFDAFQELSKQPSSSNTRTVAAQQTVTLTDALNNAYTKLDQLGDNAKNLLQTDVSDINSTLNQINKLNQEIKAVTTSGQAPNDLMDKRDILLDQLSSKFNISIEKGQFDSISVKPVDAQGMSSPNLVNGDSSDQGARFSYISSIQQDKNYPNITVISYYKLGDSSSSENLQTIRVADLSDAQKASLESGRILWADQNGQATKGDGFPIKNNEIVNANEIVQFKPSEGEVAGNISIQSDVTEYENQLNKLAKAVAFSVNAVHSGMTNTTDSNSEPSKDYVPFFVNSSVAVYDSNSNLANIDDTLNAEKDITAGNITINQEILNDVMKIKTKTNDDKFAYASENNLDGESDGARALAIANLRDSLLKVQDFGTNIKTRSDLNTTNNGMTITNDVSGTKLDAYFKDIIDKLGVQSQDAKRQATNQEAMVTSLTNSKASVSGVSLDEEMANLIQFQHAYQANAKVISTVDSLLDVVINGLKR